jgi:hypothetical protein
MIKRVEVVISDKLSESEWKSIKAFCKRAEQLTRTKLISGGSSHIQGKIRFDQEKGLYFEASLPPEEQIAEFLMAFRFFYLEKEQTHFLKILSILGKYAIEDEIRQALKRIKERWRQALFSNAAQIKINGKQMTASIVLDLWFNAHYFHSDEKKEKELEELKEIFSDDFAKFMLLDAAYESAKLIFKTYDELKGMVTKSLSMPPVRK